jgi:DNA-binding transcriptional regulator YhcF (GntR family)
MNLRIDRELPVPIGVQLRGLIEYGIACGELAAGTRLPSVRELADEVGVAPMTVSQVYKELKAGGLLDMRAGRGTFVAAGDGAAHPTRLVELQAAIDRLIADARSHGLTPQELSSLFSSRLLTRAARDQSLSIVLMGLFPEATRAYATSLTGQLPKTDRVEPMTLDAVRTQPGLLARANAADLVLTFAHLRLEVSRLLPGTRVAAVSFIPSERTRMALAALDPAARLCLVATFGAFLPIMKAGVRRFAPHVATLRAGALDTPGLAQLLERVDTVVYASGAETVLDRLPAAMRTIEYRHMPDPGEIHRLVLPLLARLRAGRPAPATVSEEGTP